MDKKKIYREYKIIKHIKAWYLLILALVFLGFGVYGLRQNNFEMIRLRDAVYAADEQNGDVEKALKDLREFVYNHMNTNLSSGNSPIKPPIQLQHRYERLVAAENERVKATNEQIKQAAEATCAAQYPGGGFNSPRVACVAEYMRVHSVKTSAVASDLYKFDFVSPIWSPDFAGLSLLAALLFFAAFILRLIVGGWYRRNLK